MHKIDSSMTNKNMAVVLLLIFILGGWSLSEGAPAPISKEIYVRPRGRGGNGVFTDIQDAIDRGVPENNQAWVLVHVAAGIYSGNVTIPRNKPYVYLKGDGSSTTTVTWKSSTWNLLEASLTVSADNFIAQGIGFENALNLPTIIEQGKVYPAVAASVQGDKIAFYECGFSGLQDTLFDGAGRHLFKSCYIQGAVDFIFGHGTSVYEKCEIKATGPGFITAQNRQSPDSGSGFVFKFCSVTGTGPTFLGRAYGPYSRVLFYKSHLSGIIDPKGWDAWGRQGLESQITYSEVDCQGEGANMSRRVPWMKRLSRSELKSLVGKAFIDHDRWLENQPLIV